MKKNIEVTYSSSATIADPKNKYENQKPMYSAKSIIELDQVGAEHFSERDEYMRLKGIIDPLLDEHIKALKEDTSHLRFRVFQHKNYPSVTTILKFDQPYIGDEEYGIRGTEVHDMFYDMFRNGKWREPKKELTRLSYDDVKYKEWWSKFKKDISFPDTFPEPIEVFHKKYIYSGEIDLVCNINGGKALCDIKTGGWDWTQLIAYYYALNDSQIKYLCVWDLKNMKLEVIEPNSLKAQQAWEKFLIRRGEFKQRYGV